MSRVSLLDRLVAIWKQENPAETMALPAPTGMHRRQFLKILGSSAAVAAAVPMMDLERLLWTPGQVAVPEIGGNILLTTEFIVRESLRVLQNNLRMAAEANTYYDERFVRTTMEFPVATVTAPRIGVDTVNDWRERIKPAVMSSAQVREAPLPIDAFTNEVVLIQPSKDDSLKFTGYGVINHGQMMIRLNDV